jgi:hypothetical protein
LASASRSCSGCTSGDGLDAAAFAGEHTVMNRAALANLCLCPMWHQPQGRGGAQR